MRPRSTSYVYPGTDITNPQAQAFQAAGFEIALHLSTDCANFTPASLEDDWATQLPEFGDDYPSARRAADQPHALHRLERLGQRAEGRAQPRRPPGHELLLLARGAGCRIGPGMFTGSGFPMRFADADGSLIDVYQAATQITDESGIDIARHIQALLDKAPGLRRLLRRLHGEHAH